MAEPLPLMVVLALTLVSSLLIGRGATGVGLPAVSGQLCAGLAVGALLLPRASAETLRHLDAAMHVIGCYVLYGLGSLLSARAFRSELRTIVALAGAALGIGVLLVAGVLMLPPPLGVALGMWTEIVLVSLVAITTSPTLVAYVCDDAAADGAFARAALGAALLLNLLVVIAAAVLWPWSAKAGLASGSAQLLAGNVFLGMAAGSAFGLAHVRLRLRPAVAIGLGLALGLVAWVATGGSWLVVMAGALMAGVASANAGPAVAVTALRAAPLRQASPALFALIAALTDVRVVLALLLPALVLVVVRAVAFVLAARVAGRLADNREIGKLGALSLLPQAGFSALLAAAMLVHAGQQWRGLLVAVVLVNAVVTPPLLTRALRAVGAGSLIRARAS